MGVIAGLELFEQKGHLSDINTHPYTAAERALFAGPHKPRLALFNQKHKDIWMQYLAVRFTELAQYLPFLPKVEPRDAAEIESEVQSDKRSESSSQEQVQTPPKSKKKPKLAKRKGSAFKSAPKNKSAKKAKPSVSK